MKIAFFGCGVIGGAVGAWISAVNEDTWLIDQGETAEAIKNGITVYQGDDKANTTVTVATKLMEDLDMLVDMDVIAIGVKNYSLPGVAELIKEKIGEKELIIIGMANGRENQDVLPRYFKNVVYCVIAFNGWIDRPGVVGYQKRGPLIFGTLDNGLQVEMKSVQEVFNKGVETIITDEIQNAVHSKMCINLTNSVTTLVGLGYGKAQGAPKDYPISDMAILQKVLSHTLYEGVLILKAAGYKECSLGGMPTWSTLKLAVTLPRFLTKGTFNKNLKKMQLASMAQDVLVYKRKSNELEGLNGYFVQLAKKYNVPAPYNEAIYELAKEKFQDPETFEPMDVKDVFARIQSLIAA